MGTTGHYRLGSRNHKPENIKLQFSFQNHVKAGFVKDGERFFIPPSQTLRFFLAFLLTYAGKSANIRVSRYFFAGRVPFSPDVIYEVGCFCKENVFLKKE
jgi:hypothetical protein